MDREIKYSLMNPSKNITILVESDCPIYDQAFVAKKLMGIENTAEQVGFISYDEKDSDISIRMAGGEFCANATMSAAVLFAIRNSLEEKNIRVFAKGVEKTYDVSVFKIENNHYKAKLDIPKPYKIEEITLLNNKTYKAVFLPGIVHIIIEDEIEKNTAEDIIKKQCDILNAEAIGFMLVDKKNMSIKPLVYVKNADTLFWENACASGSSAVGAYYIEKDNKDSISIRQPGGDVLEVRKKSNGNLELEGSVRLIKYNIAKV